MQQITTIQPTTSFFRFNWRELWEFRNLIWLFTKRDLFIIYKQTVLGPLWFVIQPVLMAVLFAVIFGRVAKINTGGIPHIIFFLSGFVVWNYFAAVTNHTATSLRSNANIFSKVWFPRLVLPVSAVITNFAHFVLGTAIFLVFYFVLLVRGVSMTPTYWLVALPLIVVHVACVGLGVGMWVAALAVKYRDLGLALPMILQIWMFSSPVVYTMAGVVDPVFRAIILCNPMAPPLELFRLAFLGVGTVDTCSIAVSSAVTLFVFVTGLAMFNRAQRKFVDIG